jgi:glycoside hydrolase-like protein
MSLSGIVQAAPSGALGFDADTVITSTTAQQFFADGYRFCVRYVSLGSEESSGDLSTEEATNILNSGLALMPVQHVMSEGWLPTAGLGQEYGTNAANHAAAVGFPAGVNLWCDLEGIGATSAQNVIDYCEAWFTAVSAAGYVPGLYAGANAILSGQQLYDLPFQHYWQSCSEVPAIPVRGYQMVQTLVQEPVNGIGIDKDVTQTDSEGGQAQWLIMTTNK